MDDGVVLTISSALVNEGLGVCRFNFRGVGRSTGSSAFTGTGDKSDLINLCKWLTSGAEVGGQQLQVSRLLLIGYSYGSMIAGLDFRV